MQLYTCICALDGLLNTGGFSWCYITLINIQWVMWNVNWSTCLIIWMVAIVSGPRSLHIISGNKHSRLYINFIAHHRLYIYFIAHHRISVCTVLKSFHKHSHTTTLTCINNVSSHYPVTTTKVTICPRQGEIRPPKIRDVTAWFNKCTVSV